MAREGDGEKAPKIKKKGKKDLTRAEVPLSSHKMNSTPGKFPFFPGKSSLEKTWKALEPWRNRDQIWDLDPTYLIAQARSPEVTPCNPFLMLHILLSDVAFCLKNFRSDNLSGVVEYENKITAGEGLGV